ncbi:MAG: hypothetical protein AAB364_00095 [Patescibacteria group bacterium]
MPDRDTKFWKKYFAKIDVPDKGPRLLSKRLNGEMTFSGMQAKFGPSTVSGSDVLRAINGGDLSKERAIHFFFLDEGAVANVFFEDNDWAILMDSVERPDIWVDHHCVWSTGFRET